jgi:hypothetical protein
MTQPTPDREREALLEWLDGQRSHVLGVLKGLSEENLRQPVLPSGWSCLALVRHLAVDDERFWFRAVAAGEALDLNDDTGWQPAPGEPAEAVLGLYRRETAASDAVLAGLSLDAPPARLLQQLAAPRRTGDHPARHHRDRGPCRAPRRGTRTARRPHLAGPGGHADPARLSGPCPVPEHRRKAAAWRTGKGRSAR